MAQDQPPLAGLYARPTGGACKATASVVHADCHALAMRKDKPAAGEDEGRVSPRGTVPPAPTVPEWLAALVADSKQYGALQPEGDIVPSWTLVFALNDPELFANRISEECRVILERVVMADLAMDVFFSRDEDEVFVKVGCAEAILMDEATYANGDPCTLPLKLKYKNPQTGELDHRPNGRAMDGTYPFHEQLREHFVKAGMGRFFHSGAQQKLVMHRFDRYCRITMEERLAMASREQLLKNAQRFSGAGQYKGRDIQLFRLKQLLESYGCTYAESAIAAQVRERLPISMEKFEAWGNANPSQLISPADFIPVVKELEGRADAKDKRTTSGSLVTCFPLHYMDELTELREKWGTFSFKFFCRCSVHKEGQEDFIGSFTGRISDNDRMMSKLWLHYQPLDEIRNYFGDHVALYFAWLGLYTQWLVAPAATGALTMAGNYINDGGLESNPLVLAYSIFLSLWSTSFLEAWKRRENELKFQWGSEGFETTEQPRVQFSGTFEVHPLTGVEKLVHKVRAQAIPPQCDFLGCLFSRLPRR